MKNLTKISPDELRKKLSNGKVGFYFQKKNGELREAVGTTVLNLIPSENHPQGIRQSSPKVVTFYDTEKQGWRAVSISSEIWQDDQLLSKATKKDKSRTSIGGWIRKMWNRIIG